MGNEPAHPHALRTPLTTSGDPGPHNPWADLVLAMLGVNNYPLTKVFELHDALEANGLFDPSNLGRWDRAEVARRLGAAGYRRGAVMTAIFVERLSSLGALADNREAYERVLSKGTRDEVARLLRRVKGVGPRVLDNFMVLRG